MSERRKPIWGSDQRLPPSNLQAEQALLGAILANNKAYNRVAEFLKPEHFADTAHVRIFQSISDRIEAGKLADAVTLKQEFANSGTLEDVGGASYLAQLLTAMIGISGVGEYGGAIHDAWVRRQTIEIAEAIKEQSYGGDSADGESIVRSGIEDLLELAGGFRFRTRIGFDQAIDEVLDAAEAAYRGDGKKPILTGIPSLDAIWGGLWPGLDILAARPSHGKTALGMQIAEFVASNLPDGQSVEVFSLEMPSEHLALRMFQSRTGVSSDNIRSGKIGSIAEALVEARREILTLPLQICDEPGLSLATIRIKAKANKVRYGTKFTMIDHLHRMAPASSMERAGRLEQVRYNSAGLKDLAAELGHPILLLAQLSGDVEKRPDHRPRISDIEYLPERDPDNICLFWRPELYLGSPPQDEDFKSAELAQSAKEAFYKKANRWKEKAEVIMAKRRFGAPSQTILGFDGARLRFFDDGDVNV